MLTDEVLATRAAMHHAWACVTLLVRHQRAVFDVTPRWWGEPTVWREATWNDLRELAQRMIALGTELAERIDVDAQNHVDTVRLMHLRASRSHHFMRWLGVETTALVLADDVPCPGCGGAGGWSGWDGEDWYGEPCDLCFGEKVMPRPLAEQIEMRAYLRSLIVMFVHIEPITEL